MAYGGGRLGGGAMATSAVASSPAIWSSLSAVSMNARNRLSRKLDRALSCVCDRKTSGCGGRAPGISNVPEPSGPVEIAGDLYAPISGLP